MVQKKKKKKSQNHFFLFYLKNNCCQKKCSSLIFLILGGRDSTRALQSAQFQNLGGVPWAWQSLEVEGRKSACLILDVIKRVIKWLAKTGFHGVFAGGKWTSTGPTQWKRENVTLPKHQHVGCLSRGNSLECWRCALWYQFGWAYLE